jgi:hypothetical protein
MSKYIISLNCPLNEWYIVTKKGEDELLEDLDGEVDEYSHGGELRQVEGQPQPTEEYCPSANHFMSYTKGTVWLDLFVIASVY